MLLIKSESQGTGPEMCRFLIPPAFGDLGAAPLFCLGWELLVKGQGSTVERAEIEWSQVSALSVVCWTVDSSLSFVVPGDHLGECLWYQVTTLDLSFCPLGHRQGSVAPYYLSGFISCFFVHFLCFFPPSLISCLGLGYLFICWSIHPSVHLSSVHPPMHMSKNKWPVLKADTLFLAFTLLSSLLCWFWSFLVLYLFEVL